MSSDLEELKAKARSLMASKDYADALSLIDASDKSRTDGTLLMLGADCSYELKDDLGALSKFLEYVRRFPEGRAKEFALFNAALSLKNIGSYKEAECLLRKVDANHPGVIEELADSAKVLKQMAAAQEILAQFCQEDNPGHGKANAAES